MISTLERLRGTSYQPIVIIQKLRRRYIHVNRICCSSNSDTVGVSSDRSSIFSGKSVVELIRNNESSSSTPKYLSTDALLNLLLEKSKNSLATASTASIASSKKIDDKVDDICHPKLGSLLADLGYKRVYLISIESLALLPVWERQRTLRPQRSLLIAEEKIRLSSLRGNSTAGITGIISAYMHRTSGDVGILDGQHRCHQFMQPIILKHFLIINSNVSLHRVGALAILSDKGWWDLKRKNIVMEVFLVDDEEQIVDLFRDINSAEPVRLVDMPYSHLEEEENTEDGDEDSNVISAEESKDEQNESGVELAQPTLESSTAATEPNQEQLQQTSAESFLDVPTSGTTAQEEKPSFSEEKQEAISVSVIAEPTEMAELPSTVTTPTTPTKKKIIKKKVAKSSPADTPTQPSSDGSDSIAETASTSEDSNAKKKKVKKPSAKVDQLRRDVLEEVALTLKNLHPAMVLSQKVRSPFLNLDVLRDDLFQCRFVREMKVSESGNLTAQHEQLVNRLYQRIMELNKQIGEEEVARLAAEGSMPRTLKTAEKHGVFIGLRKGWADLL